MWPQRRRSPLLFGHRFIERGPVNAYFNDNFSPPKQSAHPLFAQHRFKRNAYSTGRDRDSSMRPKGTKSGPLGPIDLDDLMHTLSLSMRDQSSTLKKGVNASSSSPSSTATTTAPLSLRKSIGVPPGDKNSMETDARRQQLLSETVSKGPAGSLLEPFSPSLLNDKSTQLHLLSRQQAHYQQEVAQQRQYLSGRVSASPGSHQLHERGFLLDVHGQPTTGGEQFNYGHTYSMAPFGGTSLSSIQAGNSFKERLVNLARSASSQLELRRQEKLARLWYWWYQKQQRFG